MIFMQIQSQLEWYEALGKHPEAVRYKNIILSDPRIGEIYRAEAEEFNEFARQEGKAHRIHVDGSTNSPDTQSRVFGKE